MSRKTSSIAAAGIIAAAVVLSGFSIYKDNHQKNSTDGTITLRMAQTSSQTGAIGQSMDAFADRIYDETGGKYKIETCLLYTSPSPRDGLLSRMPSSA